MENIFKVFANNFGMHAVSAAANIKSSKTKLCKIIQSGGFLGRLSWVINESWFTINHWPKMF